MNQSNEMINIFWMAGPAGLGGAILLIETAITFFKRRKK